MGHSPSVEDDFGTVSPRVLKVTAAVVWLVGGIVLALKGASLLWEAYLLRGTLWTGLGFPAGFLLGLIKSQRVFVPSCRRNLTRIDSLTCARIWQFFSPGFFLALALMIGAGSSLSYFAQGSFPLLILVGVLDLSISTALLVSLPTCGTVGGESGVEG